MKEDFAAALGFLFQHENVYDANGNVITENVAGDSGGLTKFGIDQASHPDIDIKNLTVTEAAAIYREDYWDEINGDNIKWPLSFVLMDIAVNNGVYRAATWLQSICNVAIDGKIGPKTTAAANRWPSRYAFKLLFKREDFYRTIATGSKAKFLKGWLNRNNDALEVAEPKPLSPSVPTDVLA